MGRDFTDRPTSSVQFVLYMMAKGTVLMRLQNKTHANAADLVDLGSFFFPGDAATTAAAFDGDASSFAVSGAATTAALAEPAGGTPEVKSWFHD